MSKRIQKIREKWSDERLLALTGTDISPSIIFDSALAADPTPNHKYVDWTLMAWENRKFQFEDIRAGGDSRVAEQLRRFESNKHKIPDPAMRSLMKYKGPGDLDEAMNNAGVSLYADDFFDLSSNQQKKLLMAKTRMESKLFEMESGIKIEIPLTMFASQMLGRNTRWCTASNKYQDNAFHEYADMGPLFIVTLPNNDKYQILFNLNEMRSVESGTGDEDIIEISKDIIESMDALDRHTSKQCSLSTYSIEVSNFIGDYILNNAPDNSGAHEFNKVYPIHHVVDAGIHRHHDALNLTVGHAKKKLAKKVEDALKSNSFLLDFTNTENGIFVDMRGLNSMTLDEARTQLDLLYTTARSDVTFQWDDASVSKVLPLIYSDMERGLFFGKSDIGVPGLKSLLPLYNKGTSDHIGTAILHQLSYNPEMSIIEEFIGMSGDDIIPSIMKVIAYGPRGTDTGSRNEPIIEEMMKRYGDYFIENFFPELADIDNKDDRDNLIVIAASSMALPHKKLPPVNARRILEVAYKPNLDDEPWDTLSAIYYSTIVGHRYIFKEEFEKLPDEMKDYYSALMSYEGYDGSRALNRVNIISELVIRNVGLNDYDCYKTIVSSFFSPDARIIEAISNDDISYLDTKIQEFKEELLDGDEREAIILTIARCGEAHTLLTGKDDLTCHATSFIGKMMADTRRGRLEDACDFVTRCYDVYSEEVKNRCLAPAKTQLIPDIR